ncbi:MAG TPA: alanine racemase [Burkholderiaceae bacterium]|nr:alanine racemase [Burkholderiaceae bacterium]
MSARPALLLEPREARLLRPSWAEIDSGALSHNVRVARRAVGPDRKIWFVCKGDGFGFGAARVAAWAVQAGVDALCVGSPEEALAIRRAGIDVEILLFACTLPQDVAALAELDVILSIHSLQMLEAVVALGRSVDAFLEIDSGFGRFGLQPAQWHKAMTQLKHAPLVQLRGLYSHLSAPEDAATSAQQAAVFAQAIADAQGLGFEQLEHIIASSRVMILHPQLHHTGVDPGRFIYGALDAALSARAGLRPLLHAVRARIIQVQAHQAGETLGLGYGAPIVLDKPMRLAVVPIGFWDGLNHAPPLGHVIVAGRFAPVVGRRSFQHTVIDVSDVPEADIGSLVTLVGRDGDCEIPIDELAATLGLPLMELMPRLVRGLPHVVLDSQDAPNPDKMALQETTQ